MRKSLFKSMAKGFAVASLAVVAGAGISAVDADAASSIQAKDVTIDYANQKMTIKETSTTKDLELFVAVPTVKVVTKTDKATGVKTTTSTISAVAATAWDEYDYNTTSGVTVDLSTLNRAKNNYIQIKGDKNAEPLTICIPAVFSKAKAVIDPITAKVELKDATNPKELKTLSATTEFRTSYSGWATYDAAKDDLKFYKQRGATLYFRIAASATGALNTATTTTDIKDTAGNAVTVYQAGSFPGIELKVAVAKLANAPKVTANYTNNTFVIPKNAEYRVNSSTALGSWSGTVGTAAKVIDANPVAAGTIEVRTAQTATKPASKVFALTYAAQEVAPVISNGAMCTLNKTTTAGKISTSSSSVANAVAFIKKSDVVNNHVAKVNIASGATTKATTDVSLVSCEYVTTLNRAKTAYTKVQLKLTNTTADVYDVVVLPSGSTETPVATAKVTKIAAAAKNKAGDLVPKATSIVVKDGDIIFIRKAGVAKTLNWATNFSAFGTVVYPAIQ